MVAASRMPFKSMKSFDNLIQLNANKYAFRHNNIQWLIRKTAAKQSKHPARGENMLESQSTCEHFVNMFKEANLCNSKVDGDWVRERVKAQKRSKYDVS